MRWGHGEMKIVKEVKIVRNVKIVKEMKKGEAQ